MGEITDVRDGTHDSPKYVQEGHPFITSKNVSNGFINYDDVQYVTDADYEEINKRSKVDVHDILMGMIGTIGNLALIRKEPDFAIKNVALIKYTGDVDYQYLYQALQAGCVTNQLSTGMDGGTQKFVSLKKIRELDIPFPDGWEQRKIGAYFSTIDHLITLHQQKITLLTKLKKAMLEKMFPKKGSVVPEFRFNGFANAWEQQKLGEVFETVTDYVAAGSFADLAENVVYRDTPNYAQLVRTTDLKNGFHSGSNVYVDKKAFDFLYRVNLDKECIILPNIGNCGEVYLVIPDDLPYKHNVLGPNAILIRSDTSDNVFLSILLQGKDFQEKLSLIISPNGQTKFNKTELKQISLNMPKQSDEQHQLGAYFSQLDHLITLHQRKIDKLKNLKKAMLDKMFI